MTYAHTKPRRAGKGRKVPNQKRKYESAVIALLNTRKLEDAAQVAGIGLRTLKRWLTLPEFRKQYDEAKAALLRGATKQLRKEASESVQTLATVRDDPTSPAAAKVRASVAILKLALDSEMQEDIIHRIEELERQSDEF